MQSSNEKVLFVRSAFLGDFAVCLPTINQIVIDQNLSPSNIFFVIFNNNGTNPVKAFFGESHIFTKNTTIVNLHRTKMFLSLKNFLFVNRNAQIDKIIYLPTWGDSFKGQIMKYLIIRLRFGALTKSFGFFKFSKKHKSIVSQYLHPFSALNLCWNKNYNCLGLLQIEKNKCRREKKTILVYPNSKLVMKVWPMENYACLINKIQGFEDCEILLIGGAEDYEYNESLLGICSKVENISNIAGSLRVNETIELMRDSDMFIGNDGFPMHLAALSDLPSIGLFTYKNPVGCWDPIIASKMVTITASAICKECYLSDCPNPVCLTSIGVETVFRVYRNMIENDAVKYNEIVKHTDILHKDLHFK